MKSWVHEVELTPEYLKRHYVERRMPVEFQIESGKSDERHRRTFPIAVFIDKIDQTPDVNMMQWVFYGKGNPKPYNYQVFSSGAVVIWGVLHDLLPQGRLQT